MTAHVPTAIRLNQPQFAFMRLPHKFRAFIAGFGTGKTTIGCHSLIEFHLRNPGLNSAYYGVTYAQIRDVFWDCLPEVAFLYDIDANIKSGDKQIYLSQYGVELGVIMCRSMDDPGSIIGYRTGHAVADEIDTLPMDKAKKAWQKIIARMRYNIPGIKNGVDVTTTPEGFKFCYQQFAKDPTPSYGMIQAPTRANAVNLPEDYIPTLEETYPAELIHAYLLGEFTNLVQGTVYRSFNRNLNNSLETVEKGDTLKVGLDFNVGSMAAVIHVERAGTPHAVDEIKNGLDTQHVCDILKERYPKHHITVYPDSTGRARKTVGAGTTDIRILKSEGFTVRAKKANPLVKDRVNSMNAAFLNAKGERRYFVNVDKCPTYVECLEQQPYDDNGQPDKDTGLDHHPDAAGYFISHDYGLAKPTTKIRD